MTNGVIYVATGIGGALAELDVSVRSVRAAMPGIPITLYTDTDVQGDFHDVRKIRTPTSTLEFFEMRSEIICDSPYDRTLHLDTDTYMASDATELFTLLDHFDVAAAHDTHRVVVPLEAVPAAFPEFNAGIICYRADAMRSLAGRWLSLYRSNARDVSFDQPWLRQALYESTLRIATLPPEFNFRFRHAGFYNVAPVILHAHATERDFARVAQVTAQMHPTYWSSYVHYDLQVWGPHGSARKLLDLRDPWARHRSTRLLRRILQRAGRVGRRSS